MPSRRITPSSPTGVIMTPSLSSSAATSRQPLPSKQSSRVHGDTITATTTTSSSGVSNSGATRKVASINMLGYVREIDLLNTDDGTITRTSDSGSVSSSCFKTTIDHDYGHGGSSLQQHPEDQLMMEEYSHSEHSSFDISASYDTTSPSVDDSIVSSDPGSSPSSSSVSKSSNKKGKKKTKGVKSWLFSSSSSSTKMTQKSSKDEKQRQRHQQEVAAKPSSLQKINEADANDDNAEMEDIDFYLIELELGEGAMRFASPQGHPSVERQLLNLSVAQRDVYNSLKQKWILSNVVAASSASNVGGGDGSNNRRRRYNATLDDMPDYMILRFARHSASSKDLHSETSSNFRMNRAWKSMRKYNMRYLHLTSKLLEEQLLSKVRRQNKYVCKRWI